nr:GspH/FimT family pseudopilin [Legionella londiniensis]
MVVILLLIGIIAISVSLTSPAGLQNTFQAEGVADVLLQDLRYTKALSMSHNQRYRLVVGAASYQIQDQNGSPVPNPETGGNNVVYPAGVTVSPATTIIFDSKGTPYDGGSSPLGSTLTFSVTKAGQTRTVSVIPQTGLIQ